MAAYVARLLRRPEGAREFVQPLCDVLTQLWYVPPKPPPTNPWSAPTKPKETQDALAEQIRRDVEESPWAPAGEREVLEADYVRALLLEVVRRAAHDWVLYRSSSRLDQRELAHDAYVWLFEEKPGHPWWTLRRQEGRSLTSFLSVCEQLDLDPDYVREKVQLLTPRSIKMAGRPPERRRRRDGYESSYYCEHSVELVPLEALDEQ